MPEQRFKRQVQVIIPLLSAAVIAAFALAAWSFRAGHNASCAARNASLDVISGLLVLAQDQTDNDPDRTVTQKQASDAYVAAALDYLNSQRC